LNNASVLEQHSALEGKKPWSAGRQAGHSELLTGLKNKYIFFLPHTTGSGKSLKDIILVAYIVVDNLRENGLN
jgi:hypothetical protein